MPSSIGSSDSPTMTTRPKRAEAVGALLQDGVRADEVDGDVEPAAAGEPPDLGDDVDGGRVEGVVGAEPQRPLAGGRATGRSR